MTGLINFRDAGEITVNRTQSMMSDMLYRCGHLADVDSIDRERLDALDFQLIVDLRYTGEQRSEPSGWSVPHGGHVLCHDRDRDGVPPHVELLQSGNVTTARVTEHYIDVYRNLPFDPVYRPLFANALRHLANGKGRALIHCSAGKDRTGMLIALIHMVLGVPRDAILKDYMRSAGDPALMSMAGRLQDTVRQRHGVDAPPAALEALLTVQPDYLLAMFDALDSGHHGVERYFAESGVSEGTFDKLRARFLQG